MRRRYSLHVLHRSALHNYNNVMLNGVAPGDTGRVTKHLAVHLAVGTKSLSLINIVSFYVRLLIKRQRNYTVAG